MDEVIEILNDRAMKPTEKRKLLISALRGTDSIGNVLKTVCEFNEKQIALIMEAVEEITRDEKVENSQTFLMFARGYICANHNSLRREASRVIGNLASKCADQMTEIIPLLLENAENNSTVIRWSGAYALARIICLSEYAVTPLYDILTHLSDKEEDNGVKNQYLGGLKKAKKFRPV